MKSETYLPRKVFLMKSFSKSLSRIESTLRSWLGEEQANQFIRDAQKEYEALIPRIPFIGNNILLFSFLIPSSRYLAVYRGLQKQGRAVEDAGRLIYLMAAEETRAIPSIGRLFMGYLWFSKMFKGLLMKRAVKSQLREYPQDWVLNFVPGDGREFDYGVDYIECVHCKFLQAENASELTPYVCATDKPISEIAGWGLSRTMTLAEGSPKCDFRFKKGGKTNVSVPLSLQA